MAPIIAPSSQPLTRQSNAPLQIRSVEVAGVMACMREMTKEATAMAALAKLDNMRCGEWIGAGIVRALNQIANEGTATLFYFHAALLLPQPCDTNKMRKAFHGFVGVHVGGLQVLRASIAQLPADSIPDGLRQSLEDSARRVQELGEALAVAQENKCRRGSVDGGEVLTGSLARLSSAVAAVCLLLRRLEE